MRIARITILIFCTGLLTGSSRTSENLKSICAAMDLPEYKTYTELSCASSIMNGVRELTHARLTAREQSYVFRLIHNSSPSLFMSLSEQERMQLLLSFMKFEDIMARAAQQTIHKDKIKLLKEAHDIMYDALNKVTRSLHNLSIDKAGIHADGLRQKLTNYRKMA